ncbi:hypothetical protein Pelo_19688 [Pelomyxa schiedti]|nr:hypothetical protein Pelo_19688 [Pelomyxa schiedti]
MPVRLRFTKTITLSEAISQLHRHILFDIPQHGCYVQPDEIMEAVLPGAQSSLFRTLFKFHNFPSPSFEQYHLANLVVKGCSARERIPFALALSAIMSSSSLSPPSPAAPTTSGFGGGETIKMTFDHDPVFHRTTEEVQELPEGGSSQFTTAAGCKESQI